MAVSKRTRSLVPAGQPAGTATWQAVGTLSGGGWATVGHWAGGTVGAAGLVVDIGPANITLAGSFVITATNEAAFDLNLDMNGGTLAPTGTLAVSQTLAITGGELLVDAAAITSSVGTVDLDNASGQHGVVLLRDGGSWTSGSLEIGAGGAGSMSLAAGTLAVTGLLSLGSGPQFNVGGTLALSGGSRATAGSLDLFGASILSLDAASSVSIATTESVAGAVLIASGASLDGAGGTVEGNVADDGLLLATSPLPGVVAIGPDVTGTLSGDGSVAIIYALTLGNAAGFSGAFSLDADAELVVGSGGLPLATLSMQNATVDLRGFGVAAPQYNSATGVLDVGAAVLNVGTGHAQVDWSTTSDGAGGVLVIDHPYNSWIAVGDDGDGNWTDADHWLTGVVPVAATTVEIGDSLNVGDFTVTVSAAGETAQELALDGGQFVVTGELTVGDTLLVHSAPLTVQDGTLSAGLLKDVGEFVTVAGGTLTTTSAEVQYGVYVQDGGIWDAGTLDAPDGYLLLQTGSTDVGGSLDVSGTLTPGLLSATGSSDARAGMVALTQGAQVTLDSSSALAVGGAAFVAGAVAIGAGATLSAQSQTGILGNMADNGVLSVFEFGSPGSLLVQGTLSGSGLVSVAQSSLELVNAAGFSGRIMLDQSMLTLDTGSAAHALLQMAGGNTVDLRQQSVPAQLGYNGATGLLTVGATTLDVGQGLSTVDFAFGSDGGDGTLLTQASSVPCYAAGTLIATEFGEAPVETLRPGDRVRTAGGRLAPVVWAGRTRIDLHRHPAPRHAAPVRIAAGAFGPGLPHRDLFVSPDHALAVGCALVPARLLANGGSVASDLARSAVTYVHVELDRHDLLLAEGVAAESFLDTGNRGLFAHAHGVRPLFPDFCMTTAASVQAFAERGCAPLLLAGPVPAAEHARLLARAASLGYRQTADADLRIEADHPATEAAAAPDGVVLRLPAGVHRLRLRSRSFVPCELDPSWPDGRQLGAALALRLHDRIPPDEAFAFGWHAPEGDGAWRWTDGDAGLILELPRAAELTVRLLPAGARYWVEPAWKSHEAAAAARRTA